MKDVPVIINNAVGELSSVEVLEYGIVAGNDGARDLANNVNVAIAEGWEPIGGVAISARGVYEAYYQSMVRKG